MARSKIGVIGYFVGVLAVTVLLSLLITIFFRKSEEKTEIARQIEIVQNMSIEKIAEVNKVKVSLVKEALQIKDEKNLSKNLNELGISEEAAKDKITKQLNFEAEEASKNFVLISIKFGLWIIFMIVVFYLLRKGKVSNKLRYSLLAISFVSFGIILGSEPNSMSTVTDMVSNYAIKGVIFPPRIIALLVFLLIVFLANKFICAWACQFGTLQDFIFRINRDSSDQKGIFKQYKVPFVISNTIRIAFFAVFVLITFLWSTNIIETINPFTIFSPTRLSIIGILFVSAVIIVSLVVYRPWCHFFCPFGLVGWLVEKFSRFKIKVNYNTCIACGECTKACPSNVMGAILKHNKVIPDCFSCGSCINACPTKSISFSSGKRDVVPKDKFLKKGKE